MFRKLIALICIFVLCSCACACAVQTLDSEEPLDEPTVTEYTPPPPGSSANDKGGRNPCAKTEMQEINGHMIPVPVLCNPNLLPSDTVPDPYKGKLPQEEMNH